MPEATPLRLLEDVKKGPGFDRTWHMMNVSKRSHLLSGPWEYVIVVSPRAYWENPGYVIGHIWRGSLCKVVPSTKSSPSLQLAEEINSLSILIPRSSRILTISK
jgi:hypothetical protein